MEDDLLDWYYQPTVDDSSYYDSLTGYEDVPTYTSSTDAYADPWASGAWDYSSYDPYTYDYSSTVEITNAAQPGEPGYGWRYFSDGTSIGPDGTYYTTNDQGQTASVWSPTSGIGSFLSNLGPSISSGLQKAFTKSDGTTDWSRVAGAATGIYSLLKNSGSGGSGGAEQPKGYQGGIPKYEAVRAQIPYDYSYDADSGRRPGSAGRRYFTSTQYVNPANAATAQAGANQAAVAYRDSQQPAAVAEQGLASGGLAELKNGRYLSGATDGMADKIPARIGKDQPAALSHGEFVIPADVVSHLGNGNSEAGANRLYKMMDTVRQARTGTKQQGKQINPDKYMPK